MSLCLIQADDSKNVSSKLSLHMESVINYHSRRQILFNQDIKRGVHVHRHCLDSGEIIRVYLSEEGLKCLFITFFYPSMGYLPAPYPLRSSHNYASYVRQFIYRYISGLITGCFQFFPVFPQRIIHNSLIDSMNSIPMDTSDFMDIFYSGMLS